ncbi:MAG: hypothetical protein ABUL44_05025 [Flavobacterium sp.]
MEVLEINSHTFFKKWQEISLLQNEILCSNWDQTGNFTSCIFTNEISMVKSMAREFGLNCTFNYYSLDAVFFTDNDLVPGIPISNTWLRNIRIAFEHENSFSSGLFQEVSHLLITKCDLRVLVTYPDNNLEWEKKRLHDLILGADAAKKISDKSSFLLIFGSKTNEAIVKWEAFVFKLNGWVSLY